MTQNAIESINFAEAQGFSFNYVGKNLPEKLPNTFCEKKEFLLSTDLNNDSDFMNHFNNLGDDSGNMR